MIYFKFQKIKKCLLALDKFNIFGIAVLRKKILKKNKFKPYLPLIYNYSPTSYSD